MAVRVSSNAIAVGKTLSTEITRNKLNGWASAALIMVMKGDYLSAEARGKISFEQYGRMSASVKNAIGFGNARDKWGRGDDRGWHHIQTFTYYSPKTRRGKNPEIHAGLYAKGIYEAGGSIGLAHMGTSLNYMKTRIKESGYIAKAWRQYQGTKMTKAALEDMFTRGITKMARDAEKRIE